MSLHFDELTPDATIAEAKLWLARANVAAEMKPASLAVWAAWYGGELLSHAESSSSWLRAFYEAAQRKDQGGLDSLVEALSGWAGQPAEHGVDETRVYVRVPPVEGE